MQSNNFFALSLIPVFIRFVTVTLELVGSCIYIPPMYLTQFFKIRDFHHSVWSASYTHCYIQWIKLQKTIVERKCVTLCVSCTLSNSSNFAKEYWLCFLKMIWQNYCNTYIRVTRLQQCFWLRETLKFVSIPGPHFKTSLNWLSKWFIVHFPPKCSHKY